MDKKTRDRQYRENERKKAREIIVAAKSKPCADCGLEYPSYVMDFDHVRGKKLFHIGATVHVGANKLLAEIEKCDVVCSNCHRIRTFGGGSSAERAQPCEG